ncbi:MAG: HAD family phosphatase [Eubacteriales bacterium]|nr:HAD family phosphatase [Eubacteriales bacterium]
MTQKPALIFDMDGVILDTEQLVRRCWNLAALDFGMQDSDPVFLTTVGTTRKHTAEILLEHYGADFPADSFNSTVSKIYHEIEAKEGVPVKPGARELLQWAQAAGYRVGLASSTRQPIVERELTRENLTQYFDYMLGGDRIARSKPFPDIYETACRDMQITPSEAYAIEDSYNGIRAAHTAGMMPVMVPDLLPPTEEMARLCRGIFPSLSAFQDFLQATH